MINYLAVTNVHLTAAFFHGLWQYNTINLIAILPTVFEMLRKGLIE